MTQAQKRKISFQDNTPVTLIALYSQGFEKNHEKWGVSYLWTMAEPTGEEVIFFATPNLNASLTGGSVKRDDKVQITKVKTDNDRAYFKVLINGIEIQRESVAPQEQAPTNTGQNPNQLPPPKQSSTPPENHSKVNMDDIEEFYARCGARAMRILDRMECPDIWTANGDVWYKLSYTLFKEGIDRNLWRAKNQNLPSPYDENDIPPPTEPPPETGGPFDDDQDLPF